MISLVAGRGLLQKINRPAVVAALLEAAGAAQPAPKYAAKILLIGDLHNCGAGFGLVRCLGEAFRPELIIDCGDLSNLGTALELVALFPLKKINFPYLLVPGNHDGKATAGFVAAMPQGRVLTEKAIEVAGFRVAGFADPYFGSREIDCQTAPERRELVSREGQRINDWLAAHPPVDIVVTHRYPVAMQIKNFDGVIVAGHTHQSAVTINPAGSMIINPGSIGGGGIRRLIAKTPASYSAALVYFDLAKKVVVVDQITFSPIRQMRPELIRHIY